MDNITFAFKCCAAGHMYNQCVKEKGLGRLQAEQNTHQYFFLDITKIESHIQRSFWTPKLKRKLRCLHHVVRTN